MADQPAVPAGAGARLARVALPLAVFLAALLARTWTVNRDLWMLGDQIRDWRIALGPFTELPLVGPPTHVGGYTIGPAFYWILWIIRLVIGPWFDNLPHAGAIGQALLQSAVDALLLAAIWKRTRSPWLALAAACLLVFSPDDLALSATIWNPMMGSTLAKAATALVLLDWPERSLARVAATVAVAWCAVQAYTGAIFVALSVFVALLARPLLSLDRREVLRRLVAIAGVVVLLQLPYLAHRVLGGADRDSMGAVFGSVQRVLIGQDTLRLGDSVAYYGTVLQALQLKPWHLGAIPALLAVCMLVVMARHRRDPALLAVTVLPQVAAIVGFAFWLGDLQTYYYFSVMPAAVLTVLLAVTAFARGRVATVLAVALAVGALAIVPTRLQVSRTIHRMPAYATLVQASRVMVKRGQAVRSVDASFLPRTCDPGFLYWILGGRFDPAAPYDAVIEPTGAVTYRLVPPSEREVPR